MLHMEKKEDMEVTDTEFIAQQVREKGYQIPENVQAAFENHVRVLVERIKNREPVNEDVEELEKQILPEDLKTAAGVLKPLCEKYEVKDFKAETALLALYLSIAKKEK